VTPDQVVDAVRAAGAAQRPIEPVGRCSVVGRLGPAGRPGPLALRMEDLYGFRSYDPGDLTLTVAAGTTLPEVTAVLAEAGQECPIEPSHPWLGTTVGGRMATGLSGLRRLGVGPIRDWLLGARFVTGDGRLVRAGGATVKNVTGYDLVRLLCGSWGTLGVLVEVTLKTRPRPAVSAWFAGFEPRERWLAKLFAPAAVVRVPGETRVLLEGPSRDVTEQAAAAGLTPAEAPTLPSGVRIAVPPRDLDAVVDRLDGLGARWAAEEGVGVVHATTLASSEALRGLREQVEDRGGRLLVYDPPDGVSALGRPANPELVARVRRALDPPGILAPWRYAV
jgi:FAD/FMN-containing dehydrogenase